MKFKEKVVLITGSGSGIGKATALAFAEEGADLVIADMNRETAAETTEEIKSKGGNAVSVQADVSQYDDVKNMFDECMNAYGRLDVAVNNAGIGGNGTKKTHDTEPDDWDKVIAVNQTGVFYCMKHELGIMREQGFGNIVNISSIAGLRGMSHAIPYVASKHAVNGMTKTAAMEYSKYGIRINSLCPVFTITNLFKPEFFGPIADKLKANIPMKRWADPKEMADAILWLASDQASFVTGLQLPVDGGLTSF